MSEWWTYRLSSFLMFSARTYWRLVEGYNRELWPWQLVALAAGSVLVLLALRRDPRMAVAISTVLAVAWLQVGWSFFWARYAQIFTAAPYLAVACCAQAALLVATAARPEPPRHPWLGLLLAGVGVLLYPAAAVLIGGRSWPEAEVAGVMPDPTAVCTIGFVLALHRRALLRIALCAIPCAILAIGWATLATLPRA
jgi:uncharacterized membrane protein (UPF0136 family)